MLIAGVNNSPEGSARELPSLTAEEQHQLRAAQGWLELGDLKSALEELEQLRGEIRVHPLVLKIRFQIYAAAGKWGNAFTVAEGLTRVVPNEADSFICRSYAARRMDGGGLLTAFDLLRDAVADFPDEPVIPYNLACYSAQLGRLDEARHWLTRTFEVSERIGTRQRWHATALKDPDLEPLWPELKK